MQRLGTWQEAPSTLQLECWGPRCPCPEISRRLLGEKLLEDRRGADLCDLGVGNGRFQVTEKVNFEIKQGVPGGSGKESSFSAGDTGPIPDLGRSHVPQISLAHAPQLLSLDSTTREAAPGRRTSTAARGKARWPHRPSTAENKCDGDDQFYQIKVKSPFYQKVLIKNVNRHAFEGDCSLANIEKACEGARAGQACHRAANTDGAETGRETLCAGVVRRQRALLGSCSGWWTSGR